MFYDYRRCPPVPPPPCPIVPQDKGKKYFYVILFIRSYIYNVKGQAIVFRRKSIESLMKLIYDFDQTYLHTSLENSFDKKQMCIHNNVDFIVKYDSCLEEVLKLINPTAYVIKLSWQNNVEIPYPPHICPQPYPIPNINPYGPNNYTPIPCQPGGNYPYTPIPQPPEGNNYPYIPIPQPPYIPSSEIPSGFIPSGEIPTGFIPPYPQPIPNKHIVPPIPPSPYDEMNRDYIKFLYGYINDLQKNQVIMSTYIEELQRRDSYLSGAISGHIATDTQLEHIRIVGIDPQTYSVTYIKPIDQSINQWDEENEYNICLSAYYVSGEVIGFRAGDDCMFDGYRLWPFDIKNHDVQFKDLANDVQDMLNKIGD